MKKRGIQLRSMVCKKTLFCNRQIKDVFLKKRNMWTDDVFPVAKANNAFDHVMIPSDETRYTIDEFMERLIMN